MWVPYSLRENDKQPIQQHKERTRRSEKKDQKKINYKIINTILVVLIILLALGICLLQQRDKRTDSKTSTQISSSSVQQKTSSSDSNSQNKTTDVEGTFVSWKYGAAITLNSDGTGRYVFADPVNSDTDDSITWKSVGKDRIEIDMHDDDISSSVIGKFSSNDGIKQVVLTSTDPSWNTEDLQKTSSDMSLNEFLRRVHDR